MHQNEIVIMKIANGWLVMIPQTHRFLPGGFTKDQFIEMGQAIAEGQGATDPILAAARNQEPAEVSIETTHQHAFKTFDEVLAFLKFKFGEAK